MRSTFIVTICVVVAGVSTGTAATQSPGRPGAANVQRERVDHVLDCMDALEPINGGYIGVRVTKTVANAKSLDTCMAALSDVRKSEPASGDELMYRMTIATLATHLAKPPAIGVEAQRLARRGAVTLQRGNDPQTLRSAQADFHSALLLAPWYADATYNLAQIERNLGQNENAIGDFAIYLATNPAASDASDVRDVVRDLRASVLRSTSNLIAACDRAKPNAQAADSDRRSCDELRLWYDRVGVMALAMFLDGETAMKMWEVLAAHR